MRRERPPAPRGCSAAATGVLLRLRGRGLAAPSGEGPESGVHLFSRHTRTHTLPKEACGPLGTQTGHWAAEIGEGGLLLQQAAGQLGSLVSARFPARRNEGKTRVAELAFLLVCGTLGYKVVLQ